MAYSYSLKIGSGCTLEGRHIFTSTRFGFSAGLRIKLTQDRLTRKCALIYIGSHDKEVLRRKEDGTQVSSRQAEHGEAMVEM